MTTKRSARKKVLFVSHVSSKRYGGAELVLDSLICGLDRERFEPVLLIQRPEMKGGHLDWDCCRNTMVEYFNFGSLVHRSKIMGLLGIGGRIFLSCFRIGYLIKKYDIDVVCANSLIGGVYSGIPARLFAKRFLYYEHNIADQRKGHLIGMALRPVARLATDIICISNSVKESLDEEGIPSYKLKMIHNGYNYSALTGAHIEHPKLPDRRREGVVRIGMVANFMPWKRHSVFLRLVDCISRTVGGCKIEAFLLGGCLPGGEKYYSEIEEWVDNYKGPAVFKMEGFQANVASWMRSFDILINPAKAEPFGLIFLEAMYLECVVVGSVEGAAPEIIQDGETGCIVDFEKIEQASRKIGSLVVDLEERKALGREARKAVLNNFTIERQLAKFEELLG